MWKIIRGQHDQEQVYVYFSFSEWSKKDSCTPAEHYPRDKLIIERSSFSSAISFRGPTCCHTAVKTGKMADARMNATVFLIIYEKKLERGKTSYRIYSI